MADPAEFMTVDDPSVSSQAQKALYGLYLKANDGTNSLVLQPDSFIGYSYSNESRISQYPQEAGAFQSYNKVDTPYDVRIRMTKSGHISDVSAFLATAESLVKGSDRFLYDMITPERTYFSGNIVKINHEHSATHGANMVTIELHMVEIRVTASAQYSNTNSPTTTGNLSNAKNPAATDPRNTGTVQPQAPSTTQQTVVQSSLADALMGGDTIVP